jgi:hypothetical protein
MSERLSSEEGQAQALIRHRWQLVQGLSSWKVLGLTAPATEAQGPGQASLLCLSGRVSHRRLGGA